MGITGVYRAASRGLMLALALVVLAACSSEGELIHRYGTGGTEAERRILFLAGRDSHGPLAHEHRAGSELLAAALRDQYPEYAVDVVYGGWPVDETLLDDIDAVVIYCDGGRGHMINDHLPRFERLLEEGVGVVALHYAVEVPANSASSAALLRAIGGYFETHWSVNPHWEAHFTQLPAHPVTRGITPFNLNDEWYFNMRFQTGMRGVRPILFAVPPLTTMERRDGPHSGNPAVRKMVAEGVPQVVAWAYNRPGGGRGFGYTGGHTHANWDDDNARQLVINAIVWVARGRS